jgi:hypothetical protein
LKGARLRKSTLAMLGAGLAAAVAVTAPVTAGAVSRPRASVPVVSGASGLFSSYYVAAASTAGALLVPQPRDGNGAPYALFGEVSYLKAGSATPVRLDPTVVSGYALNGIDSLVGDMAVIGELKTSLGSYAEAFWWKNLATGKSGTVSIPTSESLISATADGALLGSNTSTETVSDDNVATGKTRAIGTFSQPRTFVAGPSGVVVASKAGVQFFANSTWKRSQLSTSLTADCSTIASNAVACTDGTSIDRFPLPFGPVVKTVLSSRPQAVIVTPKATAWINCLPPTECVLSRVPASGGAVTNVIIPDLVAAEGAWNPLGLRAIGDTYVWASFDNASSGGGVFEMSDSSTTPGHVIAATLSPLAVSVVGISGGAVWVLDNGTSSLEIVHRRITGTSRIVLGPPVQDGSAGFANTDTTTYQMTMAVSGAEVAHSNYTNPPTPDPLSLYVRSGTTSVEVTKTLNTFAATLGLSGRYVLYEDQGGWELHDLSTARTSKLPAAVYALGGSELAWVDENGSVWEEVAGSSSAKEIVPPLAGGNQVASVEGIAVSGPGDVAWSYTACENKQCTAQNAVAGYLDTALSASAQQLANPGHFTGDLCISGNELGYLFAAPGYAIGSLYTVNLASASKTPTLLATNSYGLALGGAYAAWIGANSRLAYVTAI